MKSPSPATGTSRFPAHPAVILLLGALGWGWSCAPAPGTSETAPAREGLPGTVVVAHSLDLRDVNELIAPSTEIHTAIHYFALFLRLLDERADYQDGPPSLEPRLARSWKLSTDRQTLTFHLRPDVEWSDGVPITAEDVRWTWQAQTHPAIGWTGAETKRYIRDVEVVDPHTVRFHFDRVYPGQVLDANEGVILPRHAWSRLPFASWRDRSDWFFDHLVVSGPFDLEAWEPGERFVLVANERYYEPDRPRVRRIVFRWTPDRQAQLDLLRAGTAHLIEAARPADLEALAQDPAIALESYVRRGIQGLAWNTAHPLFAEASVRRALTLGIDRQTLVDLFHHGHARVTASPYPSDTWVHHRSLEPLPYEPERARALLDAAGWRDRDGDGIRDRDGRPFRFEILTPAGDALRRDVLVLVQDQLREIGVDARSRSLEINTQIAREIAHDFAASFVALGIGTNFDLSFFFHSQAAEGGYNFGSFAHPEIDRLLEAIPQEMDPPAAKLLYDRLQELLREEQPLTILYETRRHVPRRQELRGVDPNPLSTFANLRSWELRYR